MYTSYPPLFFLALLSWHANAQSWDGQFHGDIQGTPMTLSLQTSGNALEGTIDAQGYRYTLAGTFQEGTASGKFTDPQTQGVLDFQAERNAEGVLITLTATDPMSGQQQQHILTFRQGQAPAADSSASNTPAARDQRLVGLWSYTKSYTSGEYSFASQRKMQINPDGTYLYGDGRVAGGGPSSSVDSGGGGDVSRGQWKTEGDIIYINEGQQWQPYCRYYIEGYSMMLTFGDGSKQIWKRIQ